ncbi:MAG: GatB/YqeY domain-containing protein [Bacteroidia bacterium]|nr:GatB/YqeY domain-containing protein [Bacteroidia bacterium]
MNLEEQINADIKIAMLAREASKLEALRAIKAAILMLKTSSEGSAPDAELKALLKMVKQRKETAIIYTEQNRQDMADVELAQATIIEQYLPKQLTEEEIKTELQALIAQVGAKSIADLGKVMGVATKTFAGRADGKIVSGLVKTLLA